jgi:hypothetical protein
MNLTTTRFLTRRSFVNALAIASVLCITFSSNVQLSAQTVTTTLPTNSGSTISLYTQGTAISAPPPTGGSTLTVVPNTPPQNLGTFHIAIVPGGTLSGNAAALAAFNRAALQWESRISDPITVTINADLAALGPGILGSTGSVILQAPYDTIRNAMAADGADEPTNGITAFLPTAAQFTGTLPAGRTFSGQTIATKANLKALGFSGLDGSFGVSDAAISFSSTFAFDFDNSNGVTPGTIDFETVASHEIGHALGFFSEVDGIVAGSNPVSMTTLDLYRFATAGLPTTNADFTNFPRNLVPAADGSTSDTVNNYRMSTGLTDASWPGTDGRQASHFKDDAITSNFIGMMDPTLNFGTVQQLTDADFRAMDLIGYEVAAVPEPSTIALIAIAGLGLIARARKSRANS